MLKTFLKEKNYNKGASYELTIQDHQKIDALVKQGQIEPYKGEPQDLSNQENVLMDSSYLQTCKTFINNQFLNTEDQ